MLSRFAPRCSSWDFLGEMCFAPGEVLVSRSVFPVSACVEAAMADGSLSVRKHSVSSCPSRPAQTASAPSGIALALLVGHRPNSIGPWTRCPLFFTDTSHQSSHLLLEDVLVSKHPAVILVFYEGFAGNSRSTGLDHRGPRNTMIIDIRSPLSFYRVR